ncbi:MAG: hypothetical protein BGO49_20240 [Planctomycetales bacterium 71-10]|nr:MAG: hypothetical protein BGO49_20240 [Planctomycetales bacterium 71-10]
MAKRTHQERVVETIESPGIGSQHKSKKKQAVPEPLTPASALAGTPRKATKSPSKRVRAAKGAPTADPDERSIGERIEALREEAEVLALCLQEPDDEFDDAADEDREDDTDAALGLMEVLEEVLDPSPSVAALLVEYRPRPGWPTLDRARDVRDELELISEVFEASGIEDECFGACLEALHGWMYEF